MLGISTGAVRNRLSRGTLRSTKEKGTVYVLLPTDMSRGADRDADDTPDGMPNDLIQAMQGRIDDLRAQLEQANEANRENRRIIAALTSRIPQLEAPAETPDAAETVEDTPEEAPPPSATAGPQTATRPPQGGGLRGLRRRLLGW